MEATDLNVIIKSVILLLAANGAPILANKLFVDRLNKPIDKGLKLGDGQRVFGNTKTWRGFFTSLCATPIVANWLNIDPLIGVSFGALSMAGDLISSFIKRRLGRIESSRARGLDTLAESLLPLWLLSDPLRLSSVNILMTVVIFFLIEEYISPILYRLHIRMRPY